MLFDCMRCLCSVGRVPNKRQRACLRSECLLLQEVCSWQRIPLELHKARLTVLTWFTHRLVAFRALRFSDVAGQWSKSQHTGLVGCGRTFLYSSTKTLRQNMLVGEHSTWR